MGAYSNKHGKSFSLNSDHIHCIQSAFSKAETVGTGTISVRVREMSALYIESQLKGVKKGREQL